MKTYTGLRQDIANAIGHDFENGEVSSYSYYIAIRPKIRNQRKFMVRNLTLSCTSLGSGPGGVVYKVDVDDLDLSS